MAHTTVSTASQMTTLSYSISDAGPTSSVPSLYFDVEGINLSRHSPISIIQLHHRTPPRPEDSHTYLIDLHVLGFQAFSTPSASGGTLRSVLESAANAESVLRRPHGFQRTVHAIQDRLGRNHRSAAQGSSIEVLVWRFGFSIESDDVRNIQSKSLRGFALLLDTPC